MLSREFQQDSSADCGKDLQNPRFPRNQAEAVSQKDLLSHWAAENRCYVAVLGAGPQEFRDKCLGGDLERQADDTFIRQTELLQSGRKNCEDGILVRSARQCPA
jgi:hypothetical protein